MLNKVQNDDILQNNPVAQQSKLSGVEKKSSQNPYLKIADFGDVIDISEKARELYEKEKEIEKYREMVLDGLNSELAPEESEKVVESIKTGDYINNEVLAEKMLHKNMSFDGKALLDILFSEAEASTESVFSDLLGTDV